ncbi:hypothetical protein AAAC51_44440 [Priestia megaterium]
MANGDSQSREELFINAISLGTEVTVTLESGATFTGIFQGVVEGLINIGGTFIEVEDIIAFSF